MELSIHYLMRYDFLIENTSIGESKDSCLHVYQACHLKFVRIYSQVRKKGWFQSCAYACTKFMSLLFYLILVRSMRVLVSLAPRHASKNR